MINALNGFLVSIDQNSLIINVNGMEFFVEISTQAASYFSSLSRDKEVRVLFYLVLKIALNEIALTSFKLYLELVLNKH